MKYQIALAFFLCLLLSCATENAIPFEPVNKTEIDCSLIFSDSRKSIIELNDVLIQVGVLFDADETNVAVIHIDGRKQELNLLKSEKEGKHVKEIYANKEYKLELNYDLKYTIVGVNAKDPYFEGDCRLWHNGKESKMKIYGLHNML